MPPPGRKIKISPAKLRHIWNPHRLYFKRESMPSIRLRKNDDRLAANAPPLGSAQKGFQVGCDVNFK